jgi:hypothetical protein
VSRLCVAGEDLGAVKRSLANDVEGISLFALLDDAFILGSIDLFHGVDHDLLLFV